MPQISSWRQSLGISSCESVRVQGLSAASRACSSAKPASGNGSGGGSGFDRGFFCTGGGVGCTGSAGKWIRTCQLLYIGVGGGGGGDLTGICIQSYYKRLSKRVSY